MAVCVINCAGVFTLTDVYSKSLLSASSSFVGSCFLFWVFLSSCVFVLYRGNVGILAKAKQNDMLWSIPVSGVSLTLFFVGISAVVSSGEY